MTATKERALAKTMVKTALMQAIYQPGEKEFAKAIEGIVAENNKRKGVHASTFFYRGVSYPNLNPRQMPRSPYPLHPEFWGKVDDLLRQRNDLELYEKPMVSGFITHVLNSSDCWSDYLKVLPDTLHPLIQERRFIFTSQVSMLDDAQVQTIQTKHAKGLQLLRSRLMWNLLL